MRFSLTDVFSRATFRTAEGVVPSSSGTGPIPEKKRKMMAATEQAPWAVSVNTTLCTRGKTPVELHLLLVLGRMQRAQPCCCCLVWINSLFTSVVKAVVYGGITCDCLLQCIQVWFSSFLMTVLYGAELLIKISSAISRDASVIYDGA